MVAFVLIKGFVKVAMQFIFAVILTINSSLEYIITLCHFVIILLVQKWRIKGHILISMEMLIIL